MKILITGAAGFIGYHLTKALLTAGHTVVGVDNFCDENYPSALKHARVQDIYKTFPNCEPIEELDVCNWLSLEEVFTTHPDIEVVIHLAATPSVQYSIQNPYHVLENNISGMHNVLEACKEFKISQLLFASSSSVYGNYKAPVATADKAQPVNIYGVSKRTNELQAAAYSTMYGMNVTGMRFFNVYGEWGRPDSAIFKFTKAILANQPIEVRGDGSMTRGYTYVGDVVQSILALLDLQLKDWHLINVGGQHPCTLDTFIHTLYNVIGASSDIHRVPKLSGEIDCIYSDNRGMLCNTPLEEGITKFVTWYKTIYSLINQLNTIQ